MPEATTTSPRCRTCDAELTVKPGRRKPTYCRACALERQRASARESERRRKAGLTSQPITLTCDRCKIPFVWIRKGAKPKACEPCRPQRNREQIKAWQSRHGIRHQGETALHNCQACGAEFEYMVVIGRRPWKCDDCRASAYERHKKRSAAAARAKRPTPDLRCTCLDCNEVFLRRSPRGATPLRCPACREVYYHEYGLAYGRALSAALVEARRVTFEVAGRWADCEGCGVRLKCDRMGLFRKWCVKCLPGRKKRVRAEWCARNPEAWREILHRQNQARRARLAKVERVVYRRIDIFERDRWICQHCRKKINRKYRGTHSKAPSIDHQIPLNDGGPDKASNVVAVHFGCNSRKRDGYLPQGEQLMLIG